MAGISVLLWFYVLYLFYFFFQNLERKKKTENRKQKTEKQKEPINQTRHLTNTARCLRGCSRKYFYEKDDG